GVEELIVAPARPAHARHRPRRELRWRCRDGAPPQHLLERAGADQRRGAVRARRQVRRDAAVGRQLVSGNRFDGIERFVAEHTSLAGGSWFGVRGSLAVRGSSVQRTPNPRTPNPRTVSEPRTSNPEPRTFSP